ncbi:ufm1-specific protease 2 [Brachionus plicatilis]|uniref:Ufm1-specific protease 2 n=2 Tax=Brachionus plicatilis TaxID=10195 RepID=A0A3M7S1Y3_BRAPC|nr:ufm1-specific protease 2 [Brachionus plicatilis]
MSNSNEHNLPISFTKFDEPSENICFRIKGTLNKQTDLIQKGALDDLFDRILDNLDGFKFVIKNLNLVLSSENSKFSNCFQLLQEFVKCEEIQMNSLADSLMNCVLVDLFESKSISEKENNYSPYFTNHKGVCSFRVFNIPIDCIVFVKTEASIRSLETIIYQRLRQQISAIKNCYKKFFQNENDFVAQTFHYLISNQNLCLTCIYPSTVMEDSLAVLRNEIHSLFNLSLNQPVVRRENALVFNQKNKDLKYSKYLKNTHLSAKMSSVKNGKISLVQGDYLYFHYMQDNINDNGWGCAYRSFQTIFSWFKFQSYTQKPIPTHREIQKCLVDLGDKPKDFIGSSKWIGSMEISFCLSKMINVDSKIMSISKGSELAQKARELQYHFETEGTPVMIGGGVLAHTIIGVNFDELTGSVQYLILDPHFVGAEDIKTISEKGWIGWKDIKFWKEDSFYNLCCPMRPKGY